MTRLITSDKLIKVTITMSNSDSWKYPLTTASNAGTVLSLQPSKFCTLTQWSASVPTSRAQPKVGPECMSKITISPCFCLSKCLLGYNICVIAFILRVYAPNYSMQMIFLKKGKIFIQLWYLIISFHWGINPVLDQSRILATFCA